jgi:hypothetical protein
MRIHAVVLVVVGLGVVGCAGSLPDPIEPQDVTGTFPAAGWTAAGPGGDTVPQLAEQCAEAQNDRRGTALTINVWEGVLNLVSGVVSGTGGALGIFEVDVEPLPSILAAAGAGIGLLGNLALSLFGDRSEALRLHRRADSSWQFALMQTPSAENVEPVRSALQRCVEGQSPSRAAQ